MPADWKKVQVTINREETKAHVIVPFISAPGSLDQLLIISDVRRALQEAGVTTGIKEDTLQQIFNESIFDESVLVAEGVPPVDGKDATIEYFFKTENSLCLEEDMDGRIDYKSAFVYTNKKKGSRLCRLNPPTPGKPGLSVKGNPIEPKSGNMRKLPQGTNTEISDEDDNLLVASVDGCVSLSPTGLVEVKHSMEIPGDVDFSTGNIEYNGTLRIRGSIRSGFTVRVAGDLEVEGCVEDAEVEVGGSALIKKGFIGYGKGCIKTGGNLFIKFAQGQRIICGGNLNVGEELLHCNSLVGGNLSLTSRKGTIIGGVTEVEGSLEAKQIGNIQYTHTEISVGCSYRLLERITEIKKEIEQIKVNQEKIQRGLLSLKRLKLKCNSELPPEQKALYERLLETERYYPKHKQELENEMERTKEEIGKQKDSFVSVGILFPGVKISIGRYSRVFKDQMNNKVYRVVGGEVVAAA